MTKSRHILFVSIALFLTSACGGSEPVAKQDKPVVEQQPLRVEPKEEVAQAPQEPPFCAPEGRVIERHSWRYCKVNGVVEGGFEYKEGSAVLLSGRVTDGQMAGTWVSSYNNGKPKWSVNYENGVESGLLSLWYDNGNKRGEIQYADGKRDGVIKLFHPNEKLSMAGLYKEGKPTGFWTFFHENGEKAHQVSYSEEGKQKIHKHWDESGKEVGEARGRMDKKELIRKMSELKQEIVDCYTHNRIFDKSNGKVVVRLTIGYSGDVAHAEVFNKGFDNRFIDSCTMRAIELMRFPKNPYGMLPVFDSFTLAVE